MGKVFNAGGFSARGFTATGFKAGLLALTALASVVGASAQDHGGRGMGRQGGGFGGGGPGGGFGGGGEQRAERPQGGWQGNPQGGGQPQGSPQPGNQPQGGPQLGSQPQRGPGGWNGNGGQPQQQPRAETPQSIGMQQQPSFPANRGNPGGNWQGDGNWRGDNNGQRGGYRAGGPGTPGERPDGANWQGRGPGGGPAPMRADTNRWNDNVARINGRDIRGGEGRPPEGGNWQNRGGHPSAFQDRGRLNNSDRWRDQQRWSNDWRRDGRYDWSGYRQANRAYYRLPTYRPPVGWGYGYSNFSIGVFLGGPLYSNSYWIDDPYSYRLPPAYGTLRWIRYYDDALLVDIRDGYVVDVIHSFFW